MSQDAQSASGQTKACPKCHEQISQAAVKCKHCGADLKNWFVRHKIVTGIIALIILGIIGISAGKGVSEKPENGSASPSQATAGTTKAPEPAPIKIEAAQLFAEYKANEIAADEAYKGKILEVSGKVENVGKDLLDNPYVTLQTKPEYFGSVQCFLADAEKGEAAKLTKDMKIVVRGKGDGKLGNVSLKDCVIVQQ